MYRRKLKTPEPDNKSPINNKTKIIIASALCLLMLLLMTLFFFRNPDNGNSDNTVLNSISTAKFNSDIDSILSVYGIENSWIRDIKSKIKETGIDGKTLWTAREILIPSDLMTIEINYDISGYIRKYSLKEKVTEDPKNKNIKMLISKTDSAQTVIAALNFIYADTLKRIKPSVCIILDSIDYMQVDEAENLLNTTENVSLILPLRNDKADYQSVILESGKDYIIELTIGDENNITADVKSDMKDLTWKSKVKSIALNFHNASGIVFKNQINDKEFVNNVIKEFESYNFKVFNESIYKKQINGENKVYALINDIRSDSVSKSNKLLYKVKLNPAEFNEYKTEAYKLKKAGYKFLSFREFTSKPDSADFNSEKK